MDGLVVAALAYDDLPATLPTAWQTLRSGRIVRRFRVADLLEALGVELASIKEVHLHGGRDRVSRISGVELSRTRAELLFSFTGSDHGKPRIHYPDGPMDAGDRIDVIDDVAVYVHCEPPPLGRRRPAGMQRVDGAPERGCARVVPSRRVGPTQPR